MTITTWFTAVVEDVSDPTNSGRVRVRCLGFHNGDKAELPTQDLPWATCLLPVTSASTSGVGTSATGLVPGSWVFGFFRDGAEMQDPVILSTIASSSDVLGYDNGLSAFDGVGFKDPYGSYGVGGGYDIPGAATSGAQSGGLQGYGDFAVGQGGTLLTLEPGSTIQTQTISGIPPRPTPGSSSITQIFGRSGDESVLKSTTIPWTMKIAWEPSSTRTSIKMHRSIADIMVAALEEIKGLGMGFIKDHGLDLFGGDYNNRSVRGGTQTSDHAWGIALDLNPTVNGNKTLWVPGKQGSNGTKHMPTEAIQIFQKYGFQVGFKTGAGRRDMMHVSYVNRP
jgi:hypothetical protein